MSRAFNVALELFEKCRAHYMSRFSNFAISGRQTPLRNKTRRNLSAKFEYVTEEENSHLEPSWAILRKTPQSLTLLSPQKMTQKLNQKSAKRVVLILMNWGYT